MKPLLVFPRKFLGTRLANSAIDPSNQTTSNRLSAPRGINKSAFSTSPPGISSPTEFERFVAASTTGNVNSTIIYNYFSEQVVPWVRSLGVAIEQRVLTNTDLHASHTNQDVINLFETENMGLGFFPPHSTHYLQLQDSERGQFNTLKTSSRKSIDAWNAHLSRRKQALKLEDFPFVIHQSYLKSIEEKVTIRGLRKIGLVPFNPDAVLRKVPNAKTYAQYQAQFIQEEEERKEKEEEKEEEEVTAEDDDEISRLSPDEREDAGDDHDIRNKRFFRSASVPNDNRSPNRSRGPRLRQHVNHITFDGRFDVFDFKKQEKQRHIVNLITEQTNTQPTGRTQRGSRVGKEGDVFSSKDVTNKRNQVAVEKKAKLDRKTTAEHKKANDKKKMKEALATTKTELKETNKELKNKQKELTSALNALRNWKKKSKDCKIRKSDLAKATSTVRPYEKNRNSKAPQLLRKLRL
jgi:hypothetical protein